MNDPREGTILWAWATEYARSKDRQPRMVSAAAYWTMLIVTNVGWIIGTVLYHWFS